MTVFITQEVPNVDYSPAAEFGDLVFVTGFNDRLSPHPNSLNNPQIVNRIKQSLSAFKRGDYLICTGAPAHMLICGAVLGDKLEKMLVWDNRETRYFEMKI